MVHPAILWLIALHGAPQQAAEPPVTHYEPAGPATADGKGTAETLRLASDGYDRLTVPVTIGGSEPLRFLIDTGADRTVVSKEVAARLRLVERPRAILHSATGATSARMALVPELAVGRKIIRDLDAPLLATADIGADGILGIDTLRSQKLLFDFGACSLSMMSADEPAETVGPNDIVVRARRIDGRLVVTDAEIGDQRVTVIVDTGSQITVANLALYRRLRQAGDVSGEVPAAVISVTGQILRGDGGRIDRLRIGQAELRNLVVLFADAHIFPQLRLSDKPAILLGMNALAAFDKVLIDFRKKTIHFAFPAEPALAARKR